MIFRATSGAVVAVWQTELSSHTHILCTDKAVERFSIGLSPPGGYFAAAY